MGLPPISGRASVSNPATSGTCPDWPAWVWNKRHVVGVSRQTRPCVPPRAGPGRASRRGRACALNRAGKETSHAAAVPAVPMQKASGRFEILSRFAGASRPYYPDSWGRIALPQGATIRACQGRTCTGRLLARPPARPLDSRPTEYQSHKLMPDRRRLLSAWQPHRHPMLKTPGYWRPKAQSRKPSST